MSGPEFWFPVLVGTIAGCVIGRMLERKVIKLWDFLFPWRYDKRNPCRRYCKQCGTCEEMYSHGLFSNSTWWEVMYPVYPCSRKHGEPTMTQRAESALPDCRDPNCRDHEDGRHSHPPPRREIEKCSVCREPGCPDHM